MSTRLSILGSICLRLSILGSICPMKYEFEWELKSTRESRACLSLITLTDRQRRPLLELLMEPKIHSDFGSRFQFLHFQNFIMPVPGHSLCRVSFYIQVHIATNNTLRCISKLLGGLEYSRIFTEFYSWKYINENKFW